jgi:tRNA dimethylallyltransferase
LITSSHNLVAVVGTTASGKTRLGVQLARRYGSEIIAADSRQVYRGLDLGSGKDLAEYQAGGAPVPYHLIDTVDLESEYNVFAYQRDFFRTFDSLIDRGVLPIVVGGSGLYIEAALNQYRMVEVPVDEAWRIQAESLEDSELEARLRQTKESLHNTTDLTDRARTIRAIEIAEYSAHHAPEPAPDIRPLILGIRLEKEILHSRIRDRLVARIDEGLIEEVEALLSNGIPPEKLDFLGLEFRYVLKYVEGEIKNKNDLIQKLSAAIVQFARKQAKWFRRMERKGSVIHWIDGPDVDAACAIVSQAFPDLEVG